MILGSKKRCFFLFCGMGSLLLLSSCGKVDYSHEALLDALNAFAEERSGDAGSRLSQILSAIKALERELDKKLKDVDERAKHIIELTGRWENFSKNHLPKLQDMAEHLGKHRGDFNTLMGALNNVEEFKALSREIKDFNSAVNNTMRDDALKNLRTLSEALAGLDSNKVVDFRNALEGLVVWVEHALTTDENGVVSRVRALSTSLEKLKNLANEVNIAVKAAGQSQNNLQNRIDDVIGRLENVEKILDEIRERARVASTLHSELSCLKSVIEQFKKLTADMGYKKSEGVDST